MNLEQLNEAIALKSKALHDVFEEAGTDLDMAKVKSLTGDTAAKVEALNAMNAELSDLGKKREDLHKLINARKQADEMANYQPVPKSDPSQPSTKSLGDLIMSSPAIKSKGQSSVVDVDLKTLFERTAGFAPESVRIGRVEEYPTRAIAIADLMPQYPTTQAAIKYMEETTFTNNAAEAAETGTYGEAAMVFTERSVPVEKVAVWLPVTDEQLEDVPAMSAYINNRLGYMLKAKLDAQIMAGTGTPPQLQGLIGAAITGSINTQAKSTDPTPDAFYKAIVLCNTVGFAQPNAIIVNPSDWQDIRLLRTSDGIYIFGSPNDAGPDRMWGLPVVKTTAISANTAVLGDFAQYAGLWIRRGIEVKLTDSHDTYFISGKLAIRADMRIAVTWFRKSAFAKVTGI